MRAVVQRVSQARVIVETEIIGEIGLGLLILLGIHATDGDVQRDWLTEKLLQLRIFADEEGKMNRSLLDVGGAVLVVSQFTLYADCRKGRRPSFLEAAHPSHAEPIYEAFAQGWRDRGVPVATGRFGADMQIELVNQGPVTLVIDSPAI